MKLGWLARQRTAVVRLTALALLTGTGLYLSGQQPSAAPLGVQKIEPDLWVIEGTSNGSGDAGNIIVYPTGEGVILVDDRFDENYAQVMAAVKGVTAEPIRYVINTHHHGDHTGGNAKMLAENVQIAAHANARKHMVDGKMPGLPGMVFTKEASIFLGGNEVKMMYNGRGHTDGDIAVYVTARKTVHLGDLMAGTRGVTNPVMDYASGGSLVDWPGTLDGVLKLDIDHVVPGHGSVGTKADLAAHREKVAKIQVSVRNWLKARKSKDEITKSLIAEYDYKPINLRALDQMMEELSR